VCDWLWALYFLSPAYANIEIREREAVAQQVSALTESLLAGAVAAVGLAPARGCFVSRSR
jgi:hypothetical protein